jgi:DnaJ family protein C protein 28
MEGKQRTENGRPGAASSDAARREQERMRSEAEWRDLVSNRIDEAMRNGAFDNLPGRGKPLDLNRNPYAPEGMELAFDLLKNNDLAPAWIGKRTELLRDLERWRTHLAEVVGRYGSDFAAAARKDTAAVEAVARRWSIQRDSLGREVEALNKRVVVVNLEQPIAHLELLKLLLDDELRRADAGPWAQQG